MSDGIDPTSNGHLAGELSELPVLPPQSAPTLGPLSVRPRSNFWDRSKILLLLVALWWILLWSSMTNNPIEPFSDAARNQVVSLWWLEVLFGLEILRQANYFVSERSARWHHLWADRVFFLRDGHAVDQLDPDFTDSSLASPRA